jgi:hypothetical protein
VTWKPLDDLEEKANKVLGGGATMPAQKVDMQDLLDKRSDAFTKFSKGRDDLGDLLEKNEDAIDAVKNGLKRLAAGYEANNFGLDPKKKDDAKKIEQARKMFSGFFDGSLKNLEHDEKAIDELQKHLVQLSKYKGPGK